MKQIIALGLCVFLLTACRTSTADTTTSVSPTTLPDSAVSATAPEATVQNTETHAPIVHEIIVYVPNNTLDGFDTTAAEIKELTASNIVQILIDAGVVNNEVAANGERIDNGNLTIDLNKAFQDQIWTLGSTGERYLIASVVNTFLNAYSADSVSITIDGEVLESGHIIYDSPMNFFN